MLRRHVKQPLRLKSAGFTLIEMAIVLGIAGVLFAGLWRLLSSSNGQLRDQATASQQIQLINGINNYMQTTEGQAHLQGVAAGTSIAIPFPSSQTNAAGSPGCAGDVNMNTATTFSSLCNFLPPGFYVGSTNPYGQTYSANLLAGASTGLYSFMALTVGGDTISDTSGGRISGIIGGDGGFLYGSNVCNAANTSTACGSYGAWQSSIATYGFTAAYAVSGHIASRSFYTPSQNSNEPWLARQFMAGDNAVTPFFNTMVTSLMLGGQTFFFGTNTGLTTGGNANAAIEAQGGAINMQGGKINMYDATASAIGGAINLQGGIMQDTSSRVNITQPAINIVSSSALTNANGTDLVRFGSACSQDAGIFGAASNPCALALDVQGDSGVSGRLTANTLYAQTFIYQNSDLRLKTNIHPLQSALDDIMKIDPVTFRFRKDGTPGMGVIAQNVEKIYPDLVSEKPDGMKAVNYEGLIAPLIGAVQELKKENDDLRAQLHEQSLRQTALEHEIETKP